MSDSGGVTSNLGQAQMLSCGPYDDLPLKISFLPLQAFFISLLESNECEEMLVTL